MELFKEQLREELEKEETQFLVHGATRYLSFPLMRTLTHVIIVVSHKPGQHEVLYKDDKWKKSVLANKHKNPITNIKTRNILLVWDTLCSFLEGDTNHNFIWKQYVIAIDNLESDIHLFRSGVDS